MAFIETLLGGIPVRLILIGLAGILVSAFLWVAVSAIKENGALKVQVDNAIEVANANAAVADANAKAADKVQVIVAKGEVKKNEIRRKSAGVLGEIANAPAKEDAPLAPVLRDELDRLPAPDADTPEGRVAKGHRTLFRPDSDGRAAAPQRRSDTEGRGAGR